MRFVFLPLNIRRIRTEGAPRVVGAIAPRIKLLPTVQITVPRFTRAPFGFAALSSVTGVALSSHWGSFRREQYSRRRNISHRYMPSDVVQHESSVCHSASSTQRPPACQLSCLPGCASRRLGWQRLGLALRARGRRPPPSPWGNASHRPSAGKPARPPGSAP